MDPNSPALDESVAVPTAAEMRELGERLAGLLRAGDLIVLSGSLGAGKTTLTQGIGAGLGVRGPVTSPTFVIARQHPSLRGGPDLVHADAYRLGSRAEVDDLDLDTDVATSVTVVEWGEGPGRGPGPELPADRDQRGTAQRGAVRAGQPGGGQPGADHSAGDGDEVRTVRVLGWGDRWRDAAPAARQALAGRRA